MGAPSRPIRLRVQLASFTLVRTVLNTGYRMVYPFVPVIARGLGVDIGAVALAVTARSALGLASPALGSIADVRGRKVVMIGGLALFTLGLAVVSAWPTYPALFLSMLMAGAGKVVFDPAMQAYLGDRVHYNRRGLAIAVTEFGWSGAYLLGLPLAAWLIARAGWNGAFPWLALAGAASATALWFLLPKESPHTHGRSTLASGLRAVLTTRSAIAGLAVGVLISLANELVNIIFAVWLEDEFGLRVLALGATAAVIGIAELGGEGLVAGLADRLGKRRAIALGVVVNAAASLALPSLGRGLAGALIGLFLIYLTFEFTLVSAIPLMTEQVPGARATVMSGNVASHSAGRALGALAGPALFAVGLGANTVTAAALDGIALAFLLLLVRERPSQETSEVAERGV
jgi:predicted MFS family arabinose efflux permease